MEVLIKMVKYSLKMYLSCFSVGPQEKELRWFG